ncbi:MAG: hypothetical protein JNL58_14215 [Planctomyces sp.]|nr:hypothetical protein [Planctomyces sp.]
MNNLNTRRLNYAFGPVVAGIMIDFVDLATFGPLGLFLGFPVGAAAGFWLAQCMGLDRKLSVICAAIAGVYCTIPYTELIPLGTLVGAFVRLSDPDPPVANEVTQSEEGESK